MWSYNNAGYRKNLISGTDTPQPNTLAHPEFRGTIIFLNIACQSLSVLTFLLLRRSRLPSVQETDM